MLVTGADGFVGCRLVRRLSEEGHSVLAGVRPLPEGGTDRARTGTIPADVTQVPIELDDPGSLDDAVAGPLEAVIHLAAVASGAEAHRDPVGAWAVNTVGTVRLLHALEQRPGGEAVVFVLASTGEVYGAGPEMPRVEADPTAPRSPYAASKLAAEVAVFEAHRRWGVGGIVARAFPHTGAGQDARFVVPAFARRLVAAKCSGAGTVTVGNLSPVREFMHVSDVVGAYIRLLTSGVPGEVYNVACGRPVELATLFEELATLTGHTARPSVHPSLVRSADIPYLVGDSSKLREATGWEPRRSLEETLREVLDAEAV